MAGMTDHRKEVRLAQAALASALSGKREASHRYVQRISDECGGEGLHTALIAWSDTFVDHATDGTMARAAPKMSFIRTDTGQLDRPGSAAVPAHVQWAGRLVRARAAMDEQEWQQLIGDLPVDGFELARYVCAVVECVALTINGLPRGYARMGRET